MLAGTGGDADIVRLLLANPNIDVNQRDSQGINALYVSVYYGHLDILKSLRAAGARLEPTYKGATVLHVAAKKGYDQIASYLLHECRGQKMPLNTLKNNGQTPSMLAAENDAAGLCTVQLLNMLADSHNQTMEQLLAAGTLGRAAAAADAVAAVPTISYLTPYDVARRQLGGASNFGGFKN